MTASDLKYEVEHRGTESYFFTRSTMKFFGDTMSNYGVRSNVVIDNSDNSVEVWELWRKRPVKHNLKKSAYFNKKTFERVFPKFNN